MQNEWPPLKAFNFGRLIKSGTEEAEAWTKSWDELMRHKEWKEIVKKYEISEKQITYIKRGFMGLPFDHVNEKHTQDDSGKGDEIFPFNPHKGRKFRDVPDKYWIWISKQTWLEKWPSVAVYTKYKMELLNKDSASIDDIKTVLHTIE